MATELEWKYAVSDGAQLDQIVSDTPGSWQEIPMESRYFDTAGGDLSARRWTLRLRKEGDETVVCLKTPAQGQARGEWEWQGDSLSLAIPHLIALGAPPERAALTAARLLREVCGAAFTRRCLRVVLDGAEVEIAADLGTLRGGWKEEPLCELEVEHKSGDSAVTETFAAALAQRYGLKPEAKSKFQRARALASGT